MSKPRLKKYPTSRMGWSDWYAKEFNKTEREDAAVMAMWYQFLFLAFGER